MQKKTHLTVAIINHIMAGKEPKEFAYDHGVSKSFVGKTLGNNGIKKYFLNEKEWDDVMRKRMRNNPSIIY